MPRLLDDVDIINQRLKSEISKLEGELTALRERHEAVHDNLKDCRETLKSVDEIQRRHARLEKDYKTLLNVLRDISNGNVEDPIAFAKRKLEDVQVF